LFWFILIFIRIQSLTGQLYSVFTFRSKINCLCVNFSTGTKSALQINAIWAGWFCRAYLILSQEIKSQIPASAPTVIWCLNSTQIREIKKKSYLGKSKFFKIIWNHKYNVRLWNIIWYFLLLLFRVKFYSSNQVSQEMWVSTIIYRDRCFLWHLISLK
jgi:hypothetical protein